MAANTVKEAIRSGDVDALDEDKLEELGFNANSVVGDDGFTLVHWACHYGRAEVSFTNSLVNDLSNFYACMSDTG